MDGIIKEPLGGAHSNPEKMFQIVKGEIKKNLNKLLESDPNQRIEKRIDKFCSMGVYLEV